MGCEGREGGRRMTNIIVNVHTEDGATATEMECSLEKDSTGKRYFDLWIGEFPKSLHVYLSPQGLWRLKRVLQDAEIKLKRMKREEGYEG